MPVLYRCKCCGGELKVQEGSKVCECEYCGTKQTVSSSNDEVIVNLFNRANNLRIKAEFDKAEAIYEKIVEKDDSNSEAHWGIVLCKYGIEYVDDPETGKKIPTCHRTLFESVMVDPDYQAAIDYSSSEQQSIYESEARQIDCIQRDILDIVKNEKPFDVFICYKETDENGQRTKDSVIANDIYYQLAQEGFKVFYAAITLEDKLGQEYEPYIFAALNSAKVMLVVGSKPEYFNAVWVKNEWSRYLSLMKADKSKLLIPCYKDMDAYDLPIEFSHFQAQDMSKIGFINDVIRGIKKILIPEKTNKVSPTVQQANISSTDITPLLKRTYLFLEDGDYEEANLYSERILDHDPENAQAYLCKLMIDCHVKKEEDLRNCENPFEDNENYKKILRFGDERIINKLNNYISYINKQKEDKKYQEIYDSALEKMSKAKKPGNYKEASNLFADLGSFKDSKIKAEECLNIAENLRKQEIYDSAILKMQHARNIENFESVIEQFSLIAEYKDSKQQIYVCEENIKKINDDKSLKEELKIKNSNKIRKNITKLFIIFVVITIVAYFTHAFFKTINSNSNNKSLDYDENSYLGDLIKFGQYKDYDVYWYVLAEDNDKLLVISKCALDCLPYNTVKENVCWDDCSLRQWLNNEFLNETFSEDEKSHILITRNDNNCEDTVFLLSIDEVEKYLDSNKIIECVPTSYALEKGVSTRNNSKIDSPCIWWLRSSGSMNSDHASYVLVDGTITKSGAAVNTMYIGVRPAMWISTNKS